MSGIEPEAFWLRIRRSTTELHPRCSKEDVYFKVWGEGGEANSSDNKKVSVSFGEIQVLPPCIWTPVYVYRLWSQMVRDLKVLSSEMGPAESRLIR